MLGSLWCGWLLHAQRARSGAGAMENPPQGNGSGKGKKRRREGQDTLKYNVHVFARDGDAKAADELYEKLLGHESISQHTYNVLLGLCAGIVTNHEHQNNTTGADVSKVTQVPALKAFDIFEQMKKDGISANETTYTALIRASAKCNEPERGIKMLLEKNEQQITAKLRSCTPLLQAFADKDDLQGALQIDKHMAENEILPTEEEYKQLARVYTSANDEKGLSTLLRRMRRQLTFLSDHTNAILTEYFNAQPQYTVHKCTISEV